MCFMCTRKIDIAFELIENIQRSENVFRKLLNSTKIHNLTKIEPAPEVTSEKFSYDSDFEIIPRIRNKFILTEFKHTNIQKHESKPKPAKAEQSYETEDEFD